MCFLTTLPGIKRLLLCTRREQQMLNGTAVRPVVQFVIWPAGNLRCEWLQTAHTPSITFNYWKTANWVFFLWSFSADALLIYSLSTLLYWCRKESKKSSLVLSRPAADYASNFCGRITCNAAVLRTMRLLLAAKGMIRRDKRKQNAGHQVLRRGDGRRLLRTCEGFSETLKFFSRSLAAEEIRWAPSINDANMTVNSVVTKVSIFTRH